MRSRLLSLVLLAAFLASMLQPLTIRAQAQPGDELEQAFQEYLDALEEFLSRELMLFHVYLAEVAKMRPVPVPSEPTDKAQAALAAFLATAVEEAAAYVLSTSLASYSNTAKLPGSIEDTMKKLLGSEEYMRRVKELLFSEAASMLAAFPVEQLTSLTSDAIANISAAMLISAWFEKGVEVDIGGQKTQLSLRNLLPMGDCASVKTDVSPRLSSHGGSVVLDFSYTVRYDRACAAERLQKAAHALGPEGKRALAEMLRTVAKQLRDPELNNYPLGYAPPMEWLLDWLTRIREGIRFATALHNINEVLALLLNVLSGSAGGVAGAINIALKIYIDKSTVDVVAVLSMFATAVESARLTWVKGINNIMLREWKSDDYVKGNLDNMRFLERTVRLADRVSPGSDKVPGGLAGCLLGAQYKVERPSLTDYLKFDARYYIDTGYFVAPLTEPLSVDPGSLRGQGRLICPYLIHRKVDVVKTEELVEAGLSIALRGGDVLEVYVAYTSYTDKTFNAVVAVAGDNGFYEARNMSLGGLGDHVVMVGEFNLSGASVATAVLRIGGRVVDARTISLRGGVADAVMVAVGRNVYAYVGATLSLYPRGASAMLPGSVSVDMKLDKTEELRGVQAFYMSGDLPVNAEPGVADVAMLSIGETVTRAVYSSWGGISLKVLDTRVSPGGVVETRLQVNYTGPGRMMFDMFKPVVVVSGSEVAAVPGSRSIVDVDVLSASGRGVTFSEEVVLEWKLPREVDASGGLNYSVELRVFGVYPVASTSASMQGEGTEAQGVAVALLIDTSGSMGDGFRGRSKLDWAKDAAEQLLGMLGDRDMVAVIEFYDNAYLVKELVSAGTGRGEAASAIASMGPGGNTNIGAALLLAAEVLSSAPPGYERIAVLLTDGRPTAGPDPASTEVLGALKDAGVRVYAIGLGDDVNETLLRLIAEETGGRYFFAPTPDELASLFRETYRRGAGLPLMFHGEAVVAPGGSASWRVTLPARGMFVATLGWQGSSFDIVIEVPGLGVYTSGNASLLGLNVSRTDTSLTLRGELRLGVPLEATVRAVPLELGSPERVVLEVSAQEAALVSAEAESLVLPEGLPGELLVHGPPGRAEARLYAVDGRLVAEPRVVVEPGVGGVWGYRVELPPLGSGNYTLVVAVAPEGGVPGSTRVRIAVEPPAAGELRLVNSTVVVRPGSAARLVLEAPPGTEVEAAAVVEGADVLVMPRRLVVPPSGSAALLVLLRSAEPGRHEGVLVVRSGQGSVEAKLVVDAEPPVRLLNATLALDIVEGEPGRLVVVLEALEPVEARIRVAGGLADVAAEKVLVSRLAGGEVWRAEVELSPPGPGVYRGVLQLEAGGYSELLPVEVRVRQKPVVVTLTHTVTATETVTVERTVTSTREVTATETVEVTKPSPVYITVTAGARGAPSTVTVTLTRVEGVPAAMVAAAVLVVGAAAVAAVVLAARRR